MILITKGKVPPVFSDIKRLYLNYDELQNPYKHDMLLDLINEQGNICAYCMSRISDESSTIEHYIPRKGENGDPSLSLEYRNMFAVCSNSRKGNNGVRHCDVSKGNQLLSIDPREANDIRHISYKSNGEICSDNEDFEHDLNVTLNLNNVTLISNRKSALDSALRELSKLHQGSWTKQQVQKYLEKYQTASPKVPYVGIIVYSLKKRLDRIT